MKFKLTSGLSAAENAETAHYRRRASEVCGAVLGRAAGLQELDETGADLRRGVPGSVEVPGESVQFQPGTKTTPLEYSGLRSMQSTVGDRTLSFEQEGPEDVFRLGEDRPGAGTVYSEREVVRISRGTGGITYEASTPSVNYPSDIAVSSKFSDGQKVQLLQEGARRDRLVGAGLVASGLVAVAAGFVASVCAESGVPLLMGGAALMVLGGSGSYYLHEASVYDEFSRPKE